jgi:Recombinase/Resolvase, N terminal domain/Recombinase zinc beta ribbon domain
VVLCHSPDRLARKYACQALLTEELARAGTSVVFVKAPSGDTPEDALLVQFQGMIAEYERAQIMERTRRGKNQRARSGSVNVLSGAPFGYRYVRKSDHAAARYEVVPHEAAIVAGLFRRYADEGVAIAELARWLGSAGVTTRTGKARWDRSTIWGMLRNPAYAGRACFGKTGRLGQQAGRNRVARLAGRATGTAYTTVDRPRGDWLEIDVPALVDEATFDRVARRLAGNKKFASRASKTPSLLQGLAACSGCGYACYRGHTTTTAGNKIFYYRCIGSDNYRFEHGKVCDGKPVRADYLDQVVWDHITHLIADPALIRAEIGKRLAQIRTADPATAQRKRLDDALAKTTSAITRLIAAYQEDLLSLDELRARMPDLRGRETSLRHQAQALDAHLADREVYLKLADNLEGFLATLRKSAVTATVQDRQRVLRLLVKEVLVGPGSIVIRHSIPPRRDTSAPATDSTDSDDDSEPAPGSHLRWRSQRATLWRAGRAAPQCPAFHHPGPQQRADQGQDGPVADAFPDGLHQPVMRNRRKTAGDVGFHDPAAAPPGLINEYLQGIVRRAPRAEPETARQEVRLEDRLEHDLRGSLHDPVADSRNRQRPLLGSARLRDVNPPGRQRPVPSLPQLRGQLTEQPGHPVLLGVRQADTVNASSAAITAHILPRPVQHIPAADLVEQRREPSCRVSLGRPVKRMLQSANPVPTDSRQGGPSRNTGTHRSGPSRLRVNEAAALPSPQVVLPYGSTSTTAASDSLPAAARFPAPHRL